MAKSKLTSTFSTLALVGGLVVVGVFVIKSGVFRDIFGDVKKALGDSVDSLGRAKDQLKNSPSEGDDIKKLQVETKGQIVEQTRAQTEEIKGTISSESSQTDEQVANLFKAQEEAQKKAIREATKRDALINARVRAIQRELARQKSQPTADTPITFLPIKFPAKTLPPLNTRRKVTSVRTPQLRRKLLTQIKKRRGR